VGKEFANIFIELFVILRVWVDIVVNSYPVRADLVVLLYIHLSSSRLLVDHRIVGLRAKQMLWNVNIPVFILCFYSCISIKRAIEGK
jgi:hypothetical protein